MGLAAAAALLPFSHSFVHPSMGNGDVSLLNTVQLLEWESEDTVLFLPIDSFL